MVIFQASESHIRRRTWTSRNIILHNKCQISLYIVYYKEFAHYYPSSLFLCIWLFFFSIYVAVMFVVIVVHSLFRLATKRLLFIVWNIYVTHRHMNRIDFDFKLNFLLFWAVDWLKKHTLDSGSLELSRILLSSIFTPSKTFERRCTDTKNRLFVS